MEEDLKITEKIESFVFNKKELTERIHYILSKYGNDENVVIALNMIINYFKNINKDDLTATEILLQSQTSILHKEQVKCLENLIQVKDKIIELMAKEIHILGNNNTNYCDGKSNGDCEISHCKDCIKQYFEEKVDEK